MLKLVNITKVYSGKGMVDVHALRGLSVNFRRNEFVAILGASGCGKTTLLNITGGLDRYTSGDLIIEGKSTKDYNDHDWDTYRNHSVGFVFQSYNLIGHQNVLKNVELALTISGIKKEERKTRALAALKQVGLEGMERKKPNQLSGGQMQRVAIARALINNPEILLADEPTGALDSETSLQIMDLLKEVAKDRLVIMVTHNPDLAYKYANRIVKMSDGLITDDSNPYDGESEAERIAAHQNDQYSKGNKKKSSMSFPTATGLSFYNLLSKLKRTILIAVAGSIGIIGVSAVLSVSTGVNRYIDGMQDDMLSSYPLTIGERSVDYSSLMTGLSNWDKKDMAKFDTKTKIGLDSMINYLMSKYHDLTDLKENDITYELVDYVNNIPEIYVSSVALNYSIDPTNNIFTSWRRENEDPEKMASLNGITQMYIASLNTVPNFGTYSIFANLFANFMDPLPAGEDYVMAQYEQVGDKFKFPTEKDEMLLVLDKSQTMTDFLLAQLGYYSQKEFINIAKKAIKENNGEEVGPNDYYYPPDFLIEDILNKELTYFPQNTIYGTSHKVSSRQSNTFSIDGIVIPYEVSPGTMMNFTLKIDFDLYNATDDNLTGECKITASLPSGDEIPFNAEIATERVGAPTSENKFQGNWVGTISSVLGAMPVSFSIDDSEVHFLVSQDPLTYIDVPYTANDPVITDAFMYPAVKDDSWGDGLKMKITGIIKPKSGTQFGCLSRGIYFTDAFRKMYMDDSTIANGAVSKELSEYIYNGVNAEYKAYVTYQYTTFILEEVTGKTYLFDGMSNALNGTFSSAIGGLFGFSSSMTTNTDTNIIYLRSASGLASKKRTIEVLGQEVTRYEFYDLPSNISIYPKDFSAKSKVTKWLDKWNAEGDLEYVNRAGEKVMVAADKRSELTYTDTIGLIIGLINTLINAITIALIAFTSLSLVVSCFMIAVITYISTMERVKEIGVIRSLGGRKKDISRLFVAECLIIGLASGVIGVLVTYLLGAILNLSVAPFGVPTISILTIPTALIMIALSVGLNVLSGLAPSMKASRQDPVIALRTE